MPWSLAMTQKQQPTGVAEAIRSEITKIPPRELCYAKPSRILPLLEAAGFEITPSVRSATSKLLGKSKNNQAIPRQDEALIESQETTGRRELAMRFVEACGGDFDIVRAEIARLEQFIRSITTSAACFPSKELSLSEPPNMVDS